MFNSSPGCHILVVELTKWIKFVWNADKPPMPDLPYFLDYQSHKLWAPIHNDLPMCPATNRTTSSPSLSFNLMGPKLYVNTSNVTVGKRPITGMRLFLEGMKCNRFLSHYYYFFFPLLTFCCHTFSSNFIQHFKSVICSEFKKCLLLFLVIIKHYYTFDMTSQYFKYYLFFCSCYTLFYSLSWLKYLMKQFLAKNVWSMSGAYKDVWWHRLAIHVQHLLNTPIMLNDKIEDTPIWSEEISDERFFEAINGKKFSHVCTAPVKYDPRWNSDKDVAFIVTGAQLHVKKHDSKNVLHLRLLFSQVSNFVVVKSSWTQGSSGLSQKSGIFSAISTSISGKDQKKPVVILDSSVFPTGPPEPVPTKLLKFVDTSQLCKGPQDSPGHWLVTGARLVLDKGKICLWAKFSLLNTGSWHIHAHVQVKNWKSKEIFQIIYFSVNYHMHIIYIPTMDMSLFSQIHRHT